MSSYQDQYFEYTRKEMLEFIPEQITTSLEIGCGAGVFSTLLSDQGIEAWGVEPEQTPYQMASQKLHKVLLGDFKSAYGSLPQSNFDVVVFNDVLEHMADPWEAIEMTKGLLKANGCIVASIPSILYFPEFFRFLIDRDFKYTNGGTFDKTHLRFFTKRSIIRFFESCGCEIDIIGGIHPYVSRRFTLFNLLTLGYFKEMRYMQFGLRAKLKK